ncbi:cupredoxin domain-containing protein [Candidatus Pacearchaeota archaeon]|nr:cupredoxin domain-containing protein [Candidatus Pacearchaeota archaeon]
MKNTTILIIMVSIIAAVGALIFYNGDSSNNDIIDDVGGGEVQEINIGFKNGNYYPNTISIQSGKPVSITLDNSVGGCFRSFTIRALGVSKYSKTTSEKITFTPTKAGTFTFACSMGMGYGKLVVK